jgi:uncharacterized protein (DUF1697 family)
MTRFVALLRGITPSNPAMSNQNLRTVCEGIGLTNVATVISSGNVVFDAADEPAYLESKLEAAWKSELGFESTTLLRSRGDLEDLVSMRPFGDLEHGPDSYLLVTFSKFPLEIDLGRPPQPADGSARVVVATNREIFTVSDTTARQTPNVMAWVESQFGKQVSSRTWLTVARILKKMDQI